MNNNLNQAFIANEEEPMDAFNVAPNMEATIVANEVRNIPNNNGANADISMFAATNNGAANNLSTIAPNNNNWNRNQNFINMGGARKKRRTVRRTVRRRRSTRRSTQSRMRHRR